MSDQITTNIQQQEEDYNTTSPTTEDTENKEDATTTAAAAAEEEPIENPTKQDFQVSEWYKFADSLNKETFKYTAELSRQSKFKIDGKEYQRKKISVKKYKELKNIMAKYENEHNPEKKADLEIDLYAKQAEYFLGVSPEDFENMEWETIKLTLDACMFRNIKGLPD
jgi:hypothetical protein